MASTNSHSGSLSTEECCISVVLTKIEACMLPEVLQQIGFTFPTSEPAFIKLKGYMKEIEKMLLVIQTCMTGEQLSNGVTFKSWLNQTTHVVKDVEEIIDEFACLIGETKEPTSNDSDDYSVDYLLIYIAEQLKQMSSVLQNLLELNQEISLAGREQSRWLEHGSQKDNNGTLSTMDAARQITSSVNIEAKDEMVGKEEEIKNLGEGIDGEIGQPVKWIVLPDVGVESFVLEKLRDVTVKEVLHLYGFTEKVEKLTSKLRQIQPFLKDAGRKQIVDKRVKQWVKEVRDVAYDIEDVIDTILSESEIFKGKKPGIEEAVKRWLKRIYKCRNFNRLVNRLGSEINIIEERLQEIEEMRIMFGLTNLGEGTEGEMRLPFQPIVLPDVDEEGIVGFEAERDVIRSLLLDEENKSRSVISIVGQGGLGKTTLARKVYNSEAVKQQFPIRIWVTISQKFNLIDILRMIVMQLHINPPRDLNDDDQLSELRELLTQEKYLMILDDIREEKFWDIIEIFFPDENNGSRILITTRKGSVVPKAHIEKVYELEYLTEELSLELFFKQALPDTNGKIPDDLYDIGKELTRKCGGLPLALRVLGGLLFRKSAENWRRQMETMDWVNDGKECIAIIGTSYEDLPVALKSCFMYFAAFPENYIINATSLLQMWVAEGFIPQQENKTLEDTAKMFLEYLVQRCMVQVSKRSWSGRIKYCCLNDILRELAIQKATEENFLQIFSESDANLTSRTSTSARRIAFHNFGDTELPKVSIVGPKLRTLIYFGKHFPSFKKLRMVRVMHLETSNTHEVYLRMEKLTTLRYFRCINRGYVVKLPDSFWNNKMLRYVKIENCILPGFVTGPSSSVKLENLEMLKGMIARDEFPHFPRIRKLGIKIRVRDSSHTALEAIANSMRKLENLESLFLGLDNLSHPAITRALKNYERMHSLYLYCFDSKPERQIGDSSLFPPSLIKLSLEHTYLKQDSMQELQKLPKLRVLLLACAAYNGRKLICSAGGFKCLQQLKLFVEPLKELKVEAGAMPLLNLLEIVSCDKLEMFPDLQYLTNLRELKLKGARMLCRPVFNCLLEGPDRHKLKHIPSITIEKY
ncbi:hypothetical protein LUZ61_020506 [Rhynchospora tenuis]|uniref:Uncharacterized protein n=1 Tax=Rhynchospora tenuis TaxID=198213 RepID=A0AAD5ZD37_9POAL|nr:hypothetical protein LUZ61_020506 [Rhynchospora tenuis]